MSLYYGPLHVQRSIPSVYTKQSQRGNTLENLIQSRNEALVYQPKGNVLERKDGKRYLSSQNSPFRHQVTRYIQRSCAESCPPRTDSKLSSRSRWTTTPDVVGFDPGLHHKNKVRSKSSISKSVIEREVTFSDEIEVCADVKRKNILKKINDNHSAKMATCCGVEIFCGSMESLDTAPEETRSVQSSNADTTSSSSLSSLTRSVSSHERRSSTSQSQRPPIPENVQRYGPRGKTISKSCGSLLPKRPTERKGIVRSLDPTELVKVNKISSSSQTKDATVPKCSVVKIQNFIPDFPGFCKPKRQTRKSADHKGRNTAVPLPPPNTPWVDSWKTEDRSSSCLTSKDCNSPVPSKLSGSSSNKSLSKWGSKTEKVTITIDTGNTRDQEIGGSETPPSGLNTEGSNSVAKTKLLEELSTTELAYGEELSDVSFENMPADKTTDRKEDEEWPRESIFQVEVRVPSAPPQTPNSSLATSFSGSLVSSSGGNYEDVKEFEPAIQIQNVNILDHSDSDKMKYTNGSLYDSLVSSSDQITRNSSDYFAEIQKCNEWIMEQTETYTIVPLSGERFKTIVECEDIKRCRVPATEERTMLISALPQDTSGQQQKDISTPGLDEEFEEKQEEENDCSSQSSIDSAETMNKLKDTIKTDTSCDVNEPKNDKDEQLVNEENQKVQEPVPKSVSLFRRDSGSSLCSFMSSETSSLSNSDIMTQERDLLAQEKEPGLVAMYDFSTYDNFSHSKFGNSAKRIKRRASRKRRKQQIDKENLQQFINVKIGGDETG